MKRFHFELIPFFLLVLLLLVSTDIAFSQEKMDARALTYNVLELTYNVHDMVYNGRDLIYSVKDLGSKVQVVQNKVEETQSKIQDTQNKVQDTQGKAQGLQAKVQGVNTWESNTEIRIELAADVLFDFDRADIRASAQLPLNLAAEVIRGKATGTVFIDGHTDSKGSDPYNQKLSERRADSVKGCLMNKEGLREVRFVARGFGSKRPVARNTKPDGSDDPAGRQKNRRVEIIIAKK